MVWFRIGHQGNRYVHPGRISAGCLTCAPSQWEQIYPVLNCSRASDKVSIGTLVVGSLPLSILSPVWEAAVEVRLAIALRACLSK